jgi:SAM-dependent methyltransferase
MRNNSVLKNISEVQQASEQLKSLGLFPHHDWIKSWDTYKMVDIIMRTCKKNSFLLDIGCNGSPLLPMFARLGFRNLYGCDLYLKRNISQLSRIYHHFYKKEYRPIIEMNHSNDYNLSIQDLKRTSFRYESFDCITSLSVIEHGINIRSYLKEASNILKKNGLLLTSTDYWPQKISLNSTTKDNHTDSFDNIFSREEIENMVEIARDYKLVLTEPIDFSYKERIAYWKAYKLHYTFIFFALRKSE